MLKYFGSNLVTMVHAWRAAESEIKHALRNEIAGLPGVVRVLGWRKGNREFKRHVIVFENAGR